MLISAILGPTQLRIGVSEAKFDVEHDFDVKNSLAPPTSIKNYEKLSFEIVKNSDFCFRSFDVFGTTKGRSRLKF